MRDPDNTQTTHRRLRPFSKRGRIVLTISLIVVIILAGFLYSQRHQIHLLLQSLRVPPPQPVQITPLTLPTNTVTATPGQVTSSDWPTYHQNNARTGFVAGVPAPTSLTNLWQQSLDG